jgi:hypothetical protein
MLNPPFNDVVSESEVENLRELYTPDRGAHPLVSAALHPGLGQNPGKTAVNTFRALRFVLRKFPDWVRDLRPRLLDAKDWTNAQSALAEIRACGGLLEAGFPIQLGGKKAGTGAKAEFQVSMDKRDTVIEVWGRNLSEDDRKRIADELLNLRGRESRRQFGCRSDPSA